MTDNNPIIRTYWCNAYRDTACECSTEAPYPPTRCCMQEIPC